MASVSSNIRFVCSDCAPKPQRIWDDLPDSWFVGKAVKTAFDEANLPSEHMWVLVTAAKNGVLSGTLVSCPLFLSIKRGAIVCVSRSDVSAVEPARPEEAS